MTDERAYEIALAVLDDNPEFIERWAAGRHRTPPGAGVSLRWQK